MDIGAIIIIIIVGGILVLTFYIIGLYNTLLNAKNQIENKFIIIDKELKRKISLIPELIEVLKKHVKFETNIIEEISLQEDKVHNLKSINDKIKFLNNLDKTLNKIYKLENTYPSLQKSRKLNSLKKEISEIDDKITYAKEFYNDRVNNYERLKKSYSTNIIANIFKFPKINTIK